MVQLIKDKNLPSDFKYPKALYKLIELKLTNFDVWYLMDEDSANQRMKGLEERYPDRRLIPFARRGDCDDLACFEVGKGEMVNIIHDFAAIGYEQREVFDTVWEWLRYAIEVMIEYEKME